MRFRCFTVFSNFILLATKDRTKCGDLHVIRLNVCSKIDCYVVSKGQLRHTFICMLCEFHLESPKILKASMVCVCFCSDLWYVHIKYPIVDCFFNFSFWWTEVDSESFHPYTWTCNFREVRYLCNLRFLLPTCGNHRRTQLCSIMFSCSWQSI
ncbi:hypothetical protein ABFX02_04G147200 [Erythranthe guttata]